MGISQEELYNIPTAEYVYRRGFLDKELTVYHVAFHACADLKSVEVPYFTFTKRSLDVIQICFIIYGPSLSVIFPVNILPYI